MFAIIIENLTKLKHDIFEKKKTLSLSIFYSQCDYEYEKHLEKNNNFKD